MATHDLSSVLLTPTCREYLNSIIELLLITSCNHKDILVRKVSSFDQYCSLLFYFSHLNMLVLVLLINYLLYNTNNFPTACSSNACRFLWDLSKTGAKNTAVKIRYFRCMLASSGICFCYYDWVLIVHVRFSLNSSVTWFPKLYHWDLRNSLLSEQCAW